MLSAIYFGLALFTLTTIPAQVDSCLQKYISGIFDIHEYYGTSSVLFVIPRETLCFQDYTSAHSLIHDFSKKYEFTSVIHVGQLSERAKWDRNRIGPSLIVIHLRTSSDIAEFTGNTKFPSKSDIWLLIFSSETNSSALCEYCESPEGNNFRLRLDTQVLVICCDSFALKAWWSSDGDNTETSDFGFWPNDNRTELIFYPIEALDARRSNVKGAGIRIGVVKNSALAYQDGDKIRGWFGDIINELKRSMNFTITEIVPSTRYGSWDPEAKNWTGSIGQLLLGKADIGAAGFTITNARLKVVEYTFPLAVPKNKLYIRDQGYGSTISWTSYFKVFSLSIWIATILVVTLGSILLSVIGVFRSSRSSRLVLMESYTYAWGIFCQQGLSEFPVRTPLRLVYISMFILALIINAAYAAALISFLTITPTGLPFSTLEGFVNDGSYRLIVQRNTASYEFFANTSDPVLQKMMKLMKPVDELPEKLVFGMDQVCRERVAFWTADLALITSQLKAKCQIVAIPSGYEEALAMVLPTDSQYSKAINYHLQRLENTGVMDRIRRKYYISTRYFAKVTFEEVNMWDIVPLLTILTVGMIVALIVLLGEAMYYIRPFKTNSINRRRGIDYWNKEILMYK